MPLVSTLTDIRERIKKASIGSPLAAASVTLLAASKGQPIEKLEEALQDGITDFGENRVQEAEEKWLGLRKEYPRVRLHLIGPLQSNKTKDAVLLFDVIQTIDREKVADAIKDAMEKTQKKDLECYIQVNTGEEPQKAGVAPGGADQLITYCKNIGLNLTGLMCIPPEGQPPAPHFALLRSIALKHGLKNLSMGMSEDFETAVRMGSTCVRIGRALFGERS